MWKKISKYGGLYEVSDRGEVRRALKRKLVLREGGNGYYIVALYENNKRTEEIVHRLVAKAFIPNPEKKRTINHKNGIKTDNRVENLEWATYGENMRHAFEAGIMEKSYGSKHWKAKLTETDVRRIRMALACGIKRNELVNMFDVSKLTVDKIARGDSWKHVHLNVA